jgi:hypothetical protein
MNEVRRGTVISFDATLWQAAILMDGADMEATIPVGQWVPSAMMAVDANVAVLVFGDTDTNDAVVLGAYGAAAPSSWSYPALSGLTTGQPLRATSATAAAYGALDLANANAITGLLPIANGGLALNAAPANGQVPIGNGTAYVLGTLTGTANRITVANAAGSITLSGPQDLHTAAIPTFGGLNLGTATGAGTGDVSASGTLKIGSGGNALKVSDTVALTSIITDTSNVSVPNAYFDHRTSATPINGFGYAILFALQTSTTLDQNASYEQISWVDATDATRKARRSYYIYDTARREALRIEANGTVPMIGFLGAAAQAQFASGGAAPAGGVGTAAGGWDTAAHRDSAITLLNNIRTALVNNGLMS